jgi:hypothetical protein
VWRHGERRYPGRQRHPTPLDPALLSVGVVSSVRPRVVYFVAVVCLGFRSLISVLPSVLMRQDDAQDAWRRRPLRCLPWPVCSRPCMGPTLSSVGRAYVCPVVPNIFFSSCCTSHLRVACVCRVAGRRAACVFASSSSLMAAASAAPLSTVSSRDI